MTAFMEAQRWLSFLEQEYLDTFVKTGGSAIKIVVPFDAPSRHILDTYWDGSPQRNGYVVAQICADDTKVHLIDQLFYQIASQIPWAQLSRRVITNLAAEGGYAGGQEEGPLLSQIADANGIDTNFLLGELRLSVSKQVFGQRNLSKDFRVAMTRLCLAELTGGNEGDIITRVLTDWLTGQNKAVAAVKPYQIFSTINRANARYLLESLLRWVRFAGLPGTVLILDITRITLSRNPRDGHLYYTKAQVLDTYEVLREFIDATDRLFGCVIVVVANPDFLDEEPHGRGIGAYQPLKFRVFDEIRDHQLVNPMGAMVRLMSASREGQS